MLNELIKKKKELEQQILDLTKNGRLNEVGEVSEDLKKVEKDKKTILKLMATGCSRVFMIIPI